MDICLPNISPIKSDILEYFRDEYKALIDECFEEILQNSNDIKYSKDYRSYYVDQYELHNNISENIVNTIFVELKLPKYSSDQDQNNKIIAEKLKLINNKIFNLLIHKSDKDTLLWHDQYSIYMTYCQELSSDNNTAQSKFDGKKNKVKKRGLAAKILFGKEQNTTEGTTIGVFNCQLIIGVSFRNKNYKYGLKTFGNSVKDFKVNYPVVTLENYVCKNYETSDIFEKYVLLFKHIAIKAKITNVESGDLIEMMLYNVPNGCFTEYSKLGLMRILNYIRNYSFADYKTIDEQNYAFSSIHKEYSVINAKEILKYIERYYLNLK